MILKPLPIDVLLQSVGEALERQHFFDPYSSMSDTDVLVALRRMTEWNLGFNVIRDENYGLSLELLVSRKYLPLKLCLSEICLETSGYTFMEFMDVLYEMFCDINDSVERWNYICERETPYLETPIPVYEVLDHMCSMVDQIFWRRTFETPGLSGMEVVEFYPTLATNILGPYVFEPWSLDVQLYETPDWYLFQYYLRNVYFDALSFVLYESEVGKYTQMPKFEMEEYLEDVLVSCEDSRIAWNRFLHERRNLGVQSRIDRKAKGILQTRTN